MTKSYQAKDIQVLEGLEPVRKRPGMYIGSTSLQGLHHLVWEILDNAVDEALNGHCTQIAITVDDETITISDNGRGVPVDAFRNTKKSAMEILFTTLHSGGKFDEKSYKVSGGLHGVGMAVVCALSEDLNAVSSRDGFEWSQSYSRGKALTGVKKGKKTRSHGTSVTFKPDAKIFPKTDFQINWILERAESKAFLNSGLIITVSHKKDKHRFHYPEGIRDYIRKLAENKQSLFDEPFYAETDNGHLRLEVACIWTSKTETRLLSFANAIHTPDGGTHEAGFRNGLTKALRAYLDKKKLLPKGVSSITSDDVKEGLIAIISVYLQGEVEFQGQTKGRLNSDVSSNIEQVIKDSLEQYLISHPSLADLICQRVILAAQARIASRQAKEAVQRKTNISHRLNLPGKLSDCASTDRDKSELFICEGDSAGGSSKQARDRKTQAILPIRGKILNVETATKEKILANAEIKNIISALGTGIEPQYDANKLRYGKVILMTDADVDGHHICALLLTFFYRYTPKLIEGGHLYIAQPPLYRIDAGKKIYYAIDDQEKDEIVKKIKKSKYEIGRFKGLGEMPASDLKNTTMDPKNRTMIRVTVSDAEKAGSTFDRLMGKDAQPRFNFIKEKAAFFQDLDI